MNRRHFLKAGLMTTTVLVTGTSLYGCADLDILDTELINDDVAVSLSVLLPVFLAGALPQDEQTRKVRLTETIDSMRSAMKKLPPHMLEELNDLFNLLSNRLANLAFAGAFASAQQLNMTQATALIQSWRNSYIGLLNTAYEGLKELIFAAFYSNPANWDRLNYNKPDLGV